MIEQSEEGISPKSKGILFHLKKNLQKHELLIDTLICNIFDYRKQKFKKQEFHRLIKKYDENLRLNEIDDLFDELDSNKNGFVFYEELVSALGSITQRDNPAQKLNMKSKIVKEQQKGQIQIMIQVKDLLLQTEDYLQVIDVFDTNRNGFLSVSNLQELLTNFDYNNKQKREIFLKAIFTNKKMISISELLQKLDLDHNATRVNLSDFQINQSIILQDNASVMIKKKSSESKIKIQESFAIDTFENSKFIDLQKVPKELQNYFNYGSVLEENFAMIARQYIAAQTIFFDSENPPYSKAHTWVHIAEHTNDKFFLFQKAQSVLNRDNRKGLGQMLQPKDIKQGNVGDCYFLSAVASIVEDYPQLVFRLFVLEKNPAHIYGVRLFIDGIWKTIIIDACFPVYQNGALCGAQPHHREIWVLLLQKAWAKNYKSYDNIHSGYNSEGLIAVSGAPTIEVSSRQNGFLKTIEAHLKKGAIVTCATSRDVYQLTTVQQQNLGVFSGHAYTLLKVFVDLPAHGTTVTLIKMRNPWGRKGWKGDWSFYSDKWTPILRQMVGYNVDSQDGTFFISIADFVVYFDHLNICKVNLAYQNSHVIIESNRYQFYETKFIIKEKGDFYFTIYQENPRKYKNTAVYEKSQSWLFLMKMEKGKVKAIASSAKDHHDNTIQTTLEPGNYVIISKVSWKYWENHSYTVTSYGPHKVDFSKPIIADMNMINDFIQNKSQLGFGEIDSYNNTAISKRRYFSCEEGYGFFCIVNHENFALQTTIWLQKLKGIWILPPYILPLQLIVFPYENIVVKFLVNPNGYHYHIKQNPRVMKN